MLHDKIKWIENGDSFPLNELEILPYMFFSELTLELLKKKENHCVNYFCFKIQGGLQFVIAIADDERHKIGILSHILHSTEKQQLDSLTAGNFALHIFEREINENFGVDFIGHPWLKPVRYPANRYAQKQTVNDYPFYKIESEELHEVGVGPVHAGVIEPGHFRFICNGEKVLHLEIQLGWQHRGVEQLFLDKKGILQQNILAENIAGDSAVSHSTAYSQLIESLDGIQVSEQLQIERAIAQELERIAIHTADISALCVDAAYNLGANVFGILRTGIINFTQAWCGNRLGKSLIRVGGTNFSFTEELKQKLIPILDNYEKRFIEMSHLAYRIPSIQNRFDFVGTISEKQARLLGTVGLSARMSNVKRDIRESHPYSGYKLFPYESLTLENGDVFARFLLKRKEIKMSLTHIRNMLSVHQFIAHGEKPKYDLKLKPEHFAISLVEGWRGEICHCAVTNSQGELQYYKVKDPSLHNWKALELSLRNVEISDFPINNKSYNLSYCGNDL